MKYYIVSYTKKLTGEIISLSIEYEGTHEECLDFNERNPEKIETTKCKNVKVDLHKFNDLLKREVLL